MPDRQLLHIVIGGELKDVQANEFRDLSKVEFSCGKTPKVLDVDGAGSGDVTDRFVDYSARLNTDLVSQSLSTGAARLPPEAIQRIALYPDSAVCKDPR